MSGVLPATGTQIQMGRVAYALGINATSSGQTRLNGNLGVGRNRNLSGVGSIASGSQTRESTDFGGLQTPNPY